MSLPAKTIANFFIKKALFENEKLDVLKLNKLIYIAHGWHLAYFNEPLINEPVQAWQYGPVISNIYHEFKRCKNDPIKKTAYDFLLENGQIRYEKYEMPDDSDELIRFLSKIWETYKSYSGVQLSKWSHEPNGPWYKSWHETGAAFKKNQIIPNEMIKDYFKDLQEEK